MISPRDEKGRIFTNIKKADLVNYVNSTVDWEFDPHKYDCWKCKTVYDANPTMKKDGWVDCPNCGANNPPF